MDGYRVKPIEDLADEDLSEVLSESRAEGFRFVQRLLRDYEEGSNRFDRPGEVLLGVWTGDGRLVDLAR